MIRKRGILLLLFPLALNAACDSAQDDRLERLNASRDVWASARLESYEFTWQRFCFCPYVQPFRVLVDAGSVVGVVDTETSAELPRDRLDEFPTVDELFVELEEIIRQDPHRLEVEYDDELGYPAAVSADIDERIVDEEFSYTVIDLGPAPIPRAAP